MLVLTFEDNEDDMMSHILSLINTREEIIQMSGLNNHLLNFKGLLIDEVQRVIIRENQEIDLTYTEFEILKLLANDSSYYVRLGICYNVGASLETLYELQFDKKKDIGTAATRMMNRKINKE